MATAEEVRETMDVLCRYYRDSNNNPRTLDPVQIAVYLDGLFEYPAETIALAARAWMRQSRWFPALSDLLETLGRFRSSKSLRPKWYEECDALHGGRCGNATFHKAVMEAS